jgi:hypothetical protein
MTSANGCNRNGKRVQPDDIETTRELFRELAWTGETFDDDDGENDSFDADDES